MTKEELQNVLKEMGIKVDGRWNIDKLKEILEANSIEVKGVDENGVVQDEEAFQESIGEEELVEETEEEVTGKKSWVLKSRIKYNGVVFLAGDVFPGLEEEAKLLATQNIIELK